MLPLIVGFFLAGCGALLARNFPMGAPDTGWNLTAGPTMALSTSDLPPSDYRVVASLSPSFKVSPTAAVVRTTTVNYQTIHISQSFEIQSSFLDSSTLQDMSSKSQIQFSGANVPVASLPSKAGDSSTAETPDITNTTIGFFQNDTSLQTSSSWSWHSYIFGTTFALTAILSAFSLLHYFCMTFSERIYFAISNVLLVVFCMSRCCYIFRTDFHREDIEVTSTTLFYQSSVVVLTTAIMLLDGGLCLFCQVSWWKFHPLHPTVINLFIFPYCILLTTTIFLVIVLEWLGHQRALYCLVIIQKLASIVWSWVFIIFGWVLYDRLYKASILKQGQILRATLTQLHIEGAQLPKTLPKSKLCLSVRALCVTTIIFFILNFLMAYGIFFVDHFGLAVHFHKVDSTLWGLYQNVLRIFEVGTCSCLAAAHFWSQSGHQCRPLFKKTNFWLELMHNLWRSSAERLRRLSDGHFRRNCISGNHCPLEPPSAAPFEIYYPSNRGITGTHFTFEKWERSCHSPGSSTCRPIEGMGPSVGVQPILKTFQRLSQVSPQRFQLNYARGSAPSSSWSLSSAVVAGLKSLTPTRRSSSSSVSSTSGNPFTAVASSQSSRWRPIDDNVNTFTVRSGDFLPRLPDGATQKRHHGYRKNSYQHARYGSKVRKESLTQSRVPPHVEMVHKGRISIHSARKQLPQRRELMLQYDSQSTEDSKQKEVLMVSRATQVYIPSPDKQVLAQNYQWNESQDGNTYNRRISPYECNDTEEEYGNKYYHQVGAHHSATAFQTDELGNLKHAWHGANSSTSCSSESAANSFDVCFYMYSASSEAASPSNSSPSHDFHDHFYPGICHSSQARSYTCGIKKATEHVPQHLNVYRRDNERKIPESFSRPRVEEQPVNILGVANSTSTNDNHPSLNLSLPLKDSCVTTTSATKNLQDITPDSAVYLELNLPQSAAHTPVEVKSMQTPCERLLVKKSVSLLDLSSLENNQCKRSAMLQPAVSMVILHPTEPNLNNPTMLSTLGLYGGGEGPLCTVSALSNSDSLYDSGGSTEFLRTLNNDHGRFW